MAGEKTVTQYDQVDKSNHIDLSRFAPKLRKLGKYLLKTDQPTTIKAACDKLKLNYESICTLIWKEKGKGNDFHEFIRDVSQSLLKMNRAAVYQATIRGAVGDAPSSYQDRKTFHQLTGDIKESDLKVNVNHLTIGVNIGGVQVQDDREKGVIDVEPLIPKGK